MRIQQKNLAPARRIDDEIPIGGEAMVISEFSESATRPPPTARL